MNSQNYRMGLLGVVMALIGVWGGWVPHRAAALVISGWDLAEFVKFLPNVSVIREGFLLPVWCAAIALALLANRPARRLLTRLLLTSIALALTVALLPPYPQLLNSYQTPEFRWLFFLGLSGGLIVSTIALVGPRWPRRAVGGALVVLALLGALPPLWQFLQVREAIAAVYDSSIGWGWGFWLFLAGWIIAGTAGARLVQSRSGSTPRPHPVERESETS